MFATFLLNLKPDSGSIVASKCHFVFFSAVPESVLERHEGALRAGELALLGQRVEPVLPVLAPGNGRNETEGTWKGTAVACKKYLNKSWIVLCTTIGLLEPPKLLYNTWKNAHWGNRSLAV